jgi:hypothetical protein
VHFDTGSATGGVDNEEFSRSRVANLRTFTMLKRFGAGVVCLFALASGGAWWVSSTVERAVTNTFGDATLCWFDGQYRSGRIPISVMVAHSRQAVRPWQDVYNRILVSEGAKPFHFGVLVARKPGDQPEVWGWSYRHSAFWHNEGANAFALTITGRRATLCESRRDY